MISFHISALAATLLLLLYVSINVLVPRFRKFTLKHILGLMSGTFLAGYVIYLWGFWHGASDNFFTASLRALISALEMFASRNDLIEVSEHLKEDNPLYMALFALIHFQALMLTLIFIVDIFGKRLESRILANGLVLGAKSRRLFLFDGADERTEAIVKSLEKDPGNLIVFVKGMLDPEVKSLSIFEAFIKGSRNRAKADGFEDLGHVLNTPVSLSVALSTRKGWVYRSMMKLICRCRSTEVFLLSWESAMNAEAAYALSQDLPEGMDVTIHAGVNVNRAHAGKLAGQKYVKIFNRSLRVVEDLCGRTPVLEEGKDRKTLILGFGHTAMRCVEVLSESGFKSIDVIDPETGRRKEEFLCFHPALRGKEGLRFFSHALRSNDFWAYLYENIAATGNVIIFGQDKAANYEYATQILRYAVSVKSDMSDFHIYLMEDSRQPGDDESHIHFFGTTENIYNYQQITKS